ncbi:MAG: serine hydrolase domain-containing protein [Calditrichia bacterium]
MGFGQTVTSAEMDIIARFDRRVSAYIGEGSGPGIAVAMVYDGKIIFQKGYGFRDAKTEALVDTNTVSGWLRFFKGFASALTGVLVKEGFLNWDDKVIKYIPDFTLKDTSAVRKLTIRHILSHTTGIVPHAYDTMIEDKVSFDKIVKALTTLDTHCEAEAIVTVTKTPCTA